MKEDLFPEIPYIETAMDNLRIRMVNFFKEHSLQGNDFQLPEPDKMSIVQMMRAGKIIIKTRQSIE